MPNSPFVPFVGDIPPDAKPIQQQIALDAPKANQVMAQVAYEESNKLAGLVYEECTFTIPAGVKILNTVIILRNTIVASIEAFFRVYVDTLLVYESLAYDNVGIDEVSAGLATGDGNRIDFTLFDDMITTQPINVTVRGYQLLTLNDLISTSAICTYVYIDPSLVKNY